MIPDEAFYTFYQTNKFLLRECLKFINSKKKLWLLTKKF